MSNLPDWVANAPKYVCQVCGGHHDESSHDSILTLATEQGEDPRISHREDRMREEQGR